MATKTPRPRARLKTVKHKCGCVSRGFRGRRRRVITCEKHKPDPTMLLFAAGMAAGFMLARSFEVKPK